MNWIGLVAEVLFFLPSIKSFPKSSWVFCGQGQKEYRTNNATDS